MAAGKKIELILGGVYKSDLCVDLIRIVSFDDFQVYYDTWWDHCNEWGYKDSLKRKVYFYRTSPQRILVTSEFLHVEPLSDAEIKVYRPDLPFNVCRIAELSWTDEIFSTHKSYKNYLLSKSIDVNTISGLSIPEIILVPYGLKGGHKKSVLIKAANGIDFTGIELLWHAQNAQAPYINGESETGIGLHRLGFEKGVPSFYVGGYYDSAGLLKTI